MTGKNANQMHLRKQKEPVYSQMQPVSSECIIDDRGSFFYPVTQQTVPEAPVPRAQDQSCEKEMWERNPWAVSLNLESSSRLYK